MTFLNPWGFTALFLLVPVILLYILKQQHEDRTISSTMLWQQVLRDMQAVRPWQRLKTRLLLILQIIAVLLFTLSLVRPALQGDKNGVHYIAVLDTSARMQASDIKPSRMDNAKQDISALISIMKSDDSMTIIRAGLQPFVEIGPTSDKSALRSHLDAIKATNGASEMEQALQLAYGIKQDSDLAEIHVFSDQYTEVKGDYVIHLSSGKGDNAAISNVGSSVRDNALTVLSQIVNYGDDKNVTLELYVDGTLNNVKEVFVPAGKTANVFWNDVTYPSGIIEVSIADKDDLAADNTGWAVVSEAFAVKTLLVTERNLFIERAVSLRNDIELIKSNPGQPAASDDFLLYIYDGSLPEQLPSSGHLIVFDPPAENSLGIDLGTGGDIKPGRVRASLQAINNELVQYLEPDDYHIAKARKIEVPDGFDVILEDNDKNPLLLVGEKDGRKMAIFPFLLHDSDIPLKADFPILMQNLITWMLPPVVDSSSVSYAGEPVPLQPLPGAADITVRSPSGREYRFDAYPAPIFYDTDETGIYKVTQQANNMTYNGYFSVSVPTSKVSDLRSSLQLAGGDGSHQAQQADSRVFSDIWLYAGWALIALIIAEWWVYHHGI